MHGDGLDRSGGPDQGRRGFLARSARAADRRLVMLRAPGRASRVPRSRQATRVRDRYRDPILYRAAPMQSDRPPSWSARHAVRNPRRANYREPGHRSYPRTCDLRPGRPLRFCPPQPVRPEDAPTGTRQCRLGPASGRSAPDAIGNPAYAEHCGPSHQPSPHTGHRHPIRPLRLFPPQLVRPEDAPTGTGRRGGGTPADPSAPDAICDPARAVGRTINLPHTWAIVTQSGLSESSRRNPFAQRTRPPAPDDAVAARHSTHLRLTPSAIRPGSSIVGQAINLPNTRATCTQSGLSDSSRRNPYAQRTRPPAPDDAVTTRRPTGLRLTPSAIRLGPGIAATPSAFPTLRPLALGPVFPTPPAATPTPRARAPRGPAHRHRTTPGPRRVTPQPARARRRPQSPATTAEASEVARNYPGGPPRAARAPGSGRPQVNRTTSNACPTT